ncbi:hypothetical protein Y032_0626g823 [Ancylostoma ceylanicum]|uniref:Protein kinase domain-containing protein n=1 Tax=Ancylostoma ceylanicum TaxID=53326 RepID=A0A016WKK4_9BILA|nr:hypothetical protein Y032_0626g823 [Ancylostoma ceylanicum]
MSAILSNTNLLTHTERSFCFHSQRRTHANSFYFKVQRRLCGELRRFEKMGTIAPEFLYTPYAQSSNHQVFSLATGLGASCQCLEALRELHRAGFIHRDVKPANFACGKDERIRIVGLSAQ